MKHFSKYHKLRKIINTNIFQETYFCMKNIPSIIKHNKSTCRSEQHQNTHVRKEGSEVYTVTHKNFQMLIVSKSM